MARLVWTIPALEDLDEIADYISLDDPNAARKLVRKVFHRLGGLVSNPKLGSSPKDLRGTAYRHLVITPLRIFYRIEGNQIYVIYIMRSERQFQISNLRKREE